MTETNQKRFHRELNEKELIAKLPLSSLEEADELRGEIYQEEITSKKAQKKALMKDWV